MIEAIQFSSFAEFLDMGGYGFNVWSVYGIFVVFVTLNLWLPLRRHRRILQQLRRRHRLSQPGSEALGQTVPAAGSTGGEQ